MEHGVLLITAVPADLSEKAAFIGLAVVIGAKAGVLAASTKVPSLVGKPAYIRGHLKSQLGLWASWLAGQWRPMEAQQ